MIAQDASPGTQIDLAIKPRRGDRDQAKSVAPPGLDSTFARFPHLTMRAIISRPSGAQVSSVAPAG